MRLSVAILVATIVGATGCQKTNPGLALHVVLPAQAFGNVDEVRVTLLPVTGSLGGTAADTSENGVGVHTEAGKVVLSFTRGAFPLALEFDALVVPTGDAPVTASLTAEMLQADGRVLGSSTAPQADLHPDRRTNVTLTLQCSRTDCAPVAAGRTFDLAAPNPAVKLLTINGAADGDKLTVLGVGNFSATGGDLIAASMPRGTVYVFFGRDWSVPGFATTLDSSAADVTIVGKSGETLGDAVAVGDFDGDGVDDLVVTATNASNPTSGRSGAGAAYLISGTRLGTAGSIDLPTQPADMRVYGEASQERLGSAVVLAHITSTTAVDLIIGAPGAAGVGGAAQAGRAYVIFGGATPPAQVLVGDPATGEQDATILGPAASAQLGLALAAGDLDDDQVADVALGNYLEGGKGSVHVVAGARLTAGAAVDLAAGQYDSKVIGTSGSQLGWSVAIGDVDGDGTRDLIVGARQAGVVYLLTPPLDASQLDVGANQFEVALVGPASTFFGTTLAVGNVDGDGAGDLLVGAPGANGPDGQRAGSGAAHVVLGSQIGPLVAGEHRSLQLATTPAALTVYGAARSDALGDRVVVFGSVDTSDAEGEIIVGTQLGGTTARGVIYAIQNLPTQ